MALAFFNDSALFVANADGTIPIEIAPARRRGTGPVRITPTLRSPKTGLQYNGVAQGRTL